MSAHSLTSAVGIGSRSDDLVLDDLRILRMSSSDTGSKEVRALLLLFGIVRETGTDDSKATLKVSENKNDFWRRIYKICFKSVPDN